MISEDLSSARRSRSLTQMASERETITDSSGNYSLSSIAPATYLLRIDAAGFSILESERHRRPRGKNQDTSFNAECGAGQAGSNSAE